jgi:hypothetical protein
MSRAQFVIVVALVVCSSAHGGGAPCPPPEVLPPEPPATSPEEIGRLYDCFVALEERSPDALGWVTRVQPGTFLATEFHWEPIRKYAGHEVELFDRAGAAYYWMPGAMPNATGYVPKGVYTVAVDLPHAPGRVQLKLEKRYPTAFVLLAHGPDEGAAMHLAAQPLDPAVFAAELRELADFGLVAELQALGAEATRAAARQRLADGKALAACRGLAPRLDTAIGRIETELRVSP